MLLRMNWCVTGEDSSAPAGQSALSHHCERQTKRFPKFRAFLLEHAGTMKGDQIDPVRLGKWLDKEQGRVYGNLRIDVVRHKGRGNEYVLRKIEEDAD